jgi:uncharacterized protein (TIGR02284 family)
MTTNDDASLLTLHTLLRASRDAEQGYLQAADLVAEPELVQLFADRALQRAKFAEDLRERVRTLRGDPDRAEGTPAGDVHRTWMTARAARASNETHAILSEVERGEDMAVMAYREALAERALDAQTRQLVQEQYELVQASHDRVRQLRDSATYAHR